MNTNDSILVAGREIKNMMEILIAISEPDAAAKVFGCVPDHIDLVLLPILIEGELTESCRRSRGDSADRSQQ